ncbi:MAG TPA: hypothetical protein VEM13_05440 [Gemmatimonadales bacterium]|nr:hypothetical protein [Gemmatimonadales bacterium]
MLRHTFSFAAVLSLAGALACGDRPPTTAPSHTAAPRTAPRPTAVAPPEQLARALALALGEPEFRAYVKGQLDASPFREHKLHFQRFLGANGNRALQALARGSGAAASDVAQRADSTIPLELYLPVPEHRRSWAGDANVLVATAIKDHDAPIAFDVQGNRLLLDPERPPATPVIALVPVETNFATPPSRIICYDCGGGGGYIAPPPPPPGLYMTQAHFVDDFEGWLKGSPEFEVHVLGQKDQTDSLKDYQCAGERQPSPYYFDQNDLDWSGSVMLYSKTQLDNYHTTHPGQDVRVFVVEDDDTACEIKTTNDFWQNVVNAVDGANQALTAGKDTTSSTADKTWKFAKAIQKLLTALASLINTNDELVGNAVQDSIAGEYHDGYNWVVKGEKDVTNGWIKLEMR